MRVGVGEGGGTARYSTLLSVIYMTSVFAKRKRLQARRFKKRKSATRPAGALAQHARSLVGRVVKKLWGGTWYNGTVLAYDSRVRWFRVRYDDSDEEELNKRELEAIVVPQ